MDLVQRGPSGRLDAYSACMLLWSDAVSFDLDSITWNGFAHELPHATVHGDVISLYGVSREEIAAVLPDLLELLRLLDANKDLRVPAECLAPAIRESLPAGDLTGASLFLLQSGSHTLVIEPVNPTTIRVRYDPLLARGIPHLSSLICRLVGNLRAFRGDEGSYTVEFENSSRTKGKQAIETSNEIVDGGSAYLEPRIEVRETPALPTTRLRDITDMTAGKDDSAASAETKYLRSAASLESSLYTTQKLHTSVARQLNDLMASEQCLRDQQPDRSSEEYRMPPTSSLRTMGTAKAVRSLAIRSALYLAIGIGLLMLGRRCIIGPEQMAQQVATAINNATQTTLDFLGILLGQTGLVGTDLAPAVPVEPLAGFVRGLGFILMAVGIVLPVRKILKHKHRVDRELTHTQSHATYLSALKERRRLDIEAEYAQALDAWARDLQAVAEDMDYMHKSLASLEKLESNLQDALTECYERDVLPPEMRDLVATCTMADYLETSRAQTIDGKDGALTLFRRDVTEKRAGLLPEHATELQPTLRVLTSATARLVSSTERERSAKERHVRIVTYCTDAERSIDRIRAQLT